jgi:hypothetical protein
MSLYFQQFVLWVPLYPRKRTSELAPVYEIIAWLAANDRRIVQRRVRRTKRALMRLT